MIERGDITAALALAGATTGAIELWWGSPHPALSYFSPRHAIGLFPRDVGVAELVMRVARADAAELERVAAEPGHGASAAAHIDPGQREDDRRERAQATA